MVDAGYWGSGHLAVQWGGGHLERVHTNMLLTFSSRAGDGRHEIDRHLRDDVESIKVSMRTAENLKYLVHELEEGGFADDR